MDPKPPPPPIIDAEFEVVRGPRPRWLRPNWNGLAYLAVWSASVVGALILLALAVLAVVGRI